MPIRRIPSMHDHGRRPAVALVPGKPFPGKRAGHDPAEAAVLAALPGPHERGITTHEVARRGGRPRAVLRFALELLTVSGRVVRRGLLLRRTT